MDFKGFFKNFKGSMGVSTVQGMDTNQKGPTYISHVCEKNISHLKSHTYAFVWVGRGNLEARN